MSDETRPEPESKPADPAAPKPSDALVLRSNKAAGLNAAMVGLMPTTYGELRELATILKNSQAIPGFNRQTVETTASVIMQGMELGLTPVRACQNIVNIKGNMALKADLQLALLRQSGVADYYDEGFEIRGVTDTDLADEDRQVMDAKRILALVKNVPEDAPYGWATGRRKGDKQIHTRVFTWVDADRAIIYSEDDEAKEGEAPQQGNKPKKAPKPLAEKFNFKSWPQDMYPKRARSRLIGFLFSDVTAGLPSSESLEGSGDMPEYTVETVPTGPGVDELIADIKSSDPETAAGILAGFDHLAMSDAKRLAHLLKHKDDQKAGYIWLRDEAAKRKGANKAGPRKRDQPAAPAADAKKDADKPAADAKTEPPRDVVDAQLVADDDAREKAAADFVDGLDGPGPGDNLEPRDVQPAEPAAAEAPKPTKPRTLAEMVAQFQGKLQSF